MVNNADMHTRTRRYIPPNRRTVRLVTCPECSGNVVTDTEHGETVCEDCGLVVDEDEIDRGPEWRAFNSAEKDRKSRVGAPTTHMMHDKGLSTNIGWQNKDAYGRSLSANSASRCNDSGRGTNASGRVTPRSAISSRHWAKSTVWPLRWGSRRTSVRHPASSTAAHSVTTSFRALFEGVRPTR